MSDSKRPKAREIAEQRAQARSAVGRRILKARERLHLSQVDIAERFGGTRQKVQSYERGKALPNAADMPRLAALLETTVADLFGSVTDSDRVSEPDPDLVEILRAALDRALGLIAEQRSQRGWKSG